MTKRPIRILGAVAVIPLNDGREAIVDAADAGLVSGRSWLAKGAKGYVTASTTSRGRHITICLHRLLMAAPPGVFVDHRDTDPLNNTRANLRLATPRQNSQNSSRSRNNTSGFKGVSLNKRTGRWRALIQPDRKQIYLGSFDSAEAAHAAYCEAAIKFFGDYARTS